MEAVPTLCKAVEKEKALKARGTLKGSKDRKLKSTLLRWLF